MAYHGLSYWVYHPCTFYDDSSGANTVIAAPVPNTKLNLFITTIQAKTQQQSR